MKRYQIYGNKVLSDNLLVKKVKQAAKVYEKYVDKDVLMVYATSKKGPFYSYQFHAGKQNFQHLAGIQFPDGAEAFFDRCLDNVNILKRKEIVAKDNITTTSSKINVLANALDLTKSKMYRCGEKNLITLSNSFDMAIGNSDHVMGLDKRSCKLPVPVTVMDRSIYEFCSEVSSIFLIMLKAPKDQKYSKILHEITPDILHKAYFEADIFRLIDDSLLH